MGSCEWRSVGGEVFAAGARHLGQSGEGDEQRAGVQPDDQEHEHDRDEPLDAVAQGDQQKLLRVWCHVGM